MSTTADMNAGTAKEGSRQHRADRGEPPGRHRGGPTLVYRRLRQHRGRGAAAAVPAALPRQPRQLGPRARRPPRRRARGHPARQPRRRRLDRAVPDNVDDMARDALRFVDALGLGQVDLLGFSLGGFVAQELALIRPRLVRRLVLAGTAPQGAPGSTAGPPTSYAPPRQDVPDPDGFITCSSRLGREPRAGGSSSGASSPAPRAATSRPASPPATRSSTPSRVGDAGPVEARAAAGITQPAFVADGDNDTMMITENSRLLAQHLPNSQLRIYPDSAHGSSTSTPSSSATTSARS